LRRSQGHGLRVPNAGSRAWCEFEFTAVEDKNTNGYQLDMARPATQAYYYDSSPEYARLQQIKQYTDPEDLFHTSFTVQSPTAPHV
jgi:hypothetical protein